MADKDIKMNTEKVLSDKGKERVFNAIKEYIDAEIDLRTLHIRPSLNQEEVEKRASKAGEELYSVVMGLEWRAK